MSRFVGDALVAGAPECGRGPEVLTVKLTRGQVYALSELAQGAFDDAALPSERSYLSGLIEALRAQIGGAR